MAHQLRAALFGCAVAVALAACTDQPTREPTAPALTPNATHSPDEPHFTTLTCDFSALKADARNFSAKNNDVLFTIIGELQSLARDGVKNSLDTDKVFDALSRIAAMRGTSDQNAGATGEAFHNLVRRLFGCAETSVVQGALETDFRGALGPGWAFEVRGKDGVDSATFGVYERGATAEYWAIEPPKVTPGGGGDPVQQTWGQTISAPAPDRALIFGFRISSFLTNDPKVGSAFEHRTIPATNPPGGPLVLFNGVNVGLCDVTFTTTNRVQHVGTVLPKRGLNCDDPPAFADASLLLPRAALQTFALARRLVGFLGPQPLFAAQGFGAVGGSVSELSPSAVIDLGQVVLTFVAPITNDSVSSELTDADGSPVRVQVTTLGGTPLPGVTVTLSIVGNSSVIAFFSDNGTEAVTVSRPTNADGVAKFDGVSITKAGGYTLSAAGGFDGISGTPVPSNPFQIKNQ